MQVLGKAILIKPDKLPERTPSGKLVIPKTSKEMLPEEGIIIQAGNMCKIAKTRAKVKFHRGNCSVVVIDGTDHYFSYEYKVYYYE